MSTWTPKFNSLLDIFTRKYSNQIGKKPQYICQDLIPYTINPLSLTPQPPQPPSHTPLLHYETFLMTHHHLRFVSHRSAERSEGAGPTLKQTRNVRGLSFRQLGLHGANDHLFAYLVDARTLIVLFFWQYLCLWCLVWLWCGCIWGPWRSRWR